MTKVDISKLLEFAEFRWRYDDITKIGWYCRYGEFYGNQPPNLPQDLGACFKHLVPAVYGYFIKLEKKTLIPESSSHKTHEWAKHELTKFLEQEWLHRLIFPSYSWEPFNKEPALVLCEAVERLVLKKKTVKQLRR